MRDLEKYKGVIPAFYACYDEKGEISPGRRACTDRVLYSKRREAAFTLTDPPASAFI